MKKCLLFFTIFVVIHSSIIFPSQKNQHNSEGVSFPKKKSEHKMRADSFKDSDCSICLESFNNTTCYVTKCGHPYHKSCAINLLASNRSNMSLVSKCPSCRKELDVEEAREIRATGMTNAATPEEREAVLTNRIVEAEAALQAEQQRHAFTNAKKEYYRKEIGHKILFIRFGLPFVAGLAESFFPDEDKALRLGATWVAATDALLTDTSAPILNLGTCLSLSLVAYGVGFGIGSFMQKMAALQLVLLRQDSNK